MTTLTNKELEKIISMLNRAMLEEDSHRLGDEDCGWGPALGAAAQENAIHNKEVKRMQIRLR